MGAISIEEQIACVRREIRMRENAYPTWIGKGRMKQADADRELNAMRAVLSSLERLRNDQNPGLFS